jgi:hypothetical protein
MDFVLEADLTDENILIDGSDSARMSVSPHSQLRC